MVYRGQNARDEDKRRAWRPMPQRERHDWRRDAISATGLLLFAAIAAAMHLAAIMMAFHR